MAEGSLAAAVLRNGSVQRSKTKEPNRCDLPVHQSPQCQAAAGDRFERGITTGRLSTDERQWISCLRFELLGFELLGFEPLDRRPEPGAQRILNLLLRPGAV